MILHSQFPFWCCSKKICFNNKLLSYTVHIIVYNAVFTQRTFVKTSSGQNSASICKTGVFLPFISLSLTTILRMLTPRVFHNCNSAMHICTQTTHHCLLCAPPRVMSCITSCNIVHLMAVKACGMTAHKQATIVCAAGCKKRSVHCGANEITWRVFFIY